MVGPVLRDGRGHLVPGSTVANLTALWAARELKGVSEVVCSSASHLSIKKAAAILRLNWRVLQTRPDHTLDTSALGDLSRSALVLNAGTVACGAVDPLDAGRGAAWRHIDAAWAGPMRLSTTHAATLRDIEDADSVSVSAHKWLFQPKESALVLFADTTTAHDAISFGGGYLAVPNVGVLGSHGASALPLLVTLLAWGQDGIEARIDRCMEIADRLSERIEDHPVELERFGKHRTGVVLWRPRTAPAEQVRERLVSSFVSLVDINGERWFRSVAANPLADADLVVDDTLAAIRG
ncbi:MAG: pyridoxal-dependent decarboxylase [Nocardioidaceae bacterium]